jgi:hypothetical protein
MSIVRHVQQYSFHLRKNIDMQRIQFDVKVPDVQSLIEKIMHFEV